MTAEKKKKSLKYVTQMHQKAQKSKEKVLKCATAPLQPTPSFPSQAHGSSEHPAATHSYSSSGYFKIISTQQQPHNFTPVAITNITSIILLYRCMNIPIRYYFRSPKVSKACPCSQQTGPTGELYLSVKAAGGQAGHLWHPNLD